LSANIRYSPAGLPYDPAYKAAWFEMKKI